MLNIKLKSFFNLLKNKKYKELLYEMCKHSPYGFITYVSFYFIKWENIPEKLKLRKLDSNYDFETIDFDYSFLKRIENELPHGLDTVYYRALKKEKYTKIIYIEHKKSLVAVIFVLYDNEVPSPSGYHLNFENKKVITCYDIYIKPEYRLRGLFQHLFNSVLKLADKYDCKDIYGEIHFLNKGSILSHHRLGFTAYRNIQYVQIFGRKFFFEGKPKFWCVK